MPGKTVTAFRNLQHTPESVLKGFRIISNSGLLPINKQHLQPRDLTLGF